MKLPWNWLKAFHMFCKNPWSSWARSHEDSMKMTFSKISRVVKSHKIWKIARAMKIPWIYTLMGDVRSAKPYKVKQEAMKLFSFKIFMCYKKSPFFQQLLKQNNKFGQCDIRGQYSFPSPHSFYPPREIVSFNHTIRPVYQEAVSTAWSVLGTATAILSLVSNKDLYLYPVLPGQIHTRL